MDRTKEYFVLCTMPRLHARSRLLELGVYTTVDAICNVILREKKVNGTESSIA